MTAEPLVAGLLAASCIALYTERVWADDPSAAAAPPEIATVPPRPSSAAESPRDTTTPSSALAEHSVRETWSFFGGFTSHNLANPGLHLGAEYPLGITARFRSLATASFQAYHHEDTQTGYALHARWGHRYTASFGFTFDSYLGVGAQLTRYDATVFEFEDSIAARKERSKTRVAFTPHVVFGPGYDFAQLLGAPVHVYARPGVMLVYPDLNLAFQTALIAELGVRWTPEL